jgi:apolipoprotein N-acyltransferase
MKKWLPFLPFVSAMLLAIAFTSYQLAGLAFIALVPLLHYIFTKLKQSKFSKKKFVLTIWLSGLVFFLFQLVWILFTKPEIWSGINPTTAKITQYAGWLLSALVLSSGFLIFGYLLSCRPKLMQKTHYTLLTLMSAWAFSEVLRSYLFSVLWWSPEAQLGTHWNFGSLGLAASSTPLGFAGRWVGLYGLGALVVAINLAIYWLLVRRPKPALLILCAVALLSLVGRYSFNNSSQTVKIGALQTSQQKDDFDYDLAQLVKSKGARGFDLVALPEYIDFPDRLLAQNASSFYQSFEKSGGLVVYTRTRFNEDGTRNGEIVLRNQYGQIISTQPKNLLIPGGEYLPTAMESTMKISGQSKSIESYYQNRQLNRGKDPEHAITVRNLTVGVLACSGTQSPELYRRLVAQGATILANSASLDAFADAPFFDSQSKQLARFHAIANNRTFVQAASTGSSYIIDPTGKFIVDSPKHTLAFHQANAPNNSDRTPYSRLGEIALVLAIGWIAYLLIKAPK